MFLPASYPSFGGWISILTYAVASGLPLFLIAEWGAIILRSCPDVGATLLCIVKAVIMT